MLAGTFLRFTFLMPYPMPAADADRVEVLLGDHQELVEELILLGGIRLLLDLAVERLLLLDAFRCFLCLRLRVAAGAPGRDDPGDAPERLVALGEVPPRLEHGVVEPPSPPQIEQSCSLAAFLVYISERSIAFSVALTPTAFQ